jgi:hypothetical protein
MYRGGRGVGAVVERGCSLVTALEIEVDEKERVRDRKCSEAFSTSIYRIPRITSNCGLLMYRNLYKLSGRSSRYILSVYMLRVAAAS